MNERTNFLEALEKTILNIAVHFLIKSVAEMQSCGNVLTSCFPLTMTPAVFLRRRRRRLTLTRYLARPKTEWPVPMPSQRLTLRQSMRPGKVC